MLFQHSRSKKQANQCIFTFHLKGVLFTVHLKTARAPKFVYSSAQNSTSITIVFNMSARNSREASVFVFNVSAQNSKSAHALSTFQLRTRKNNACWTFQFKATRENPRFGSTCQLKNTNIVWVFSSSTSVDCFTNSFQTWWTHMCFACAAFQMIKAIAQLCVPQFQFKTYDNTHNVSAFHIHNVRKQIMFNMRAHNKNTAIVVCVSL